MNNKLLQPSGFNNQFYGEGLSFQDYISQMRNIILEARCDLNSENAHRIIDANSPFIFEPIQDQQHTTSENGILFIHGLFDSPYFLSDIAKHLSFKNFITYSVLLPGHGTIPGDLLNINYAEWIKAVNYGIRCLASRVKNIFIVGFSLGGTLAIHHALQHKLCKGLILLAPALKTKSLLRYYIVRHHKLFSWIRDKTKWYHIAEQINFAKYNSYAFNAGYQACLVMEETHDLITKQSLNVPIFIITSQDDETVSNQAVINFFMQQKHQQSRMLCYTSQQNVFSDDRIIIRNSYFPEKKILGFSHTCLSVSPTNIYFGEHSNYKDFTHYKNTLPKNSTEIYAGAVTPENLKSHTMQRLTYNPDFENMLSLLEDFLFVNI